MRLLLASSEVHPYSKSGGLADMVAALAKALGRAGHEVVLITPLYRGIRERNADLERFDYHLDLPLGGDRVQAGVWRRPTQENLTIYFIDQPGFYDRPQLYQDGGSDYADNARRFIFFSKCVAHMSRYLAWRPELVHVHDWQTGLVPLMILHQRWHEGWWDAPKTCLTIHNLAYQGGFSRGDYDLCNLPLEYFGLNGVEFWGGLNCLKAGLVYADVLTTVSPRYAREITTPAYGCGLDPVLRARQTSLFGILNGVDYDEWNTTQNKHLTAAYSIEAMDGKAADKAALQAEMGLPIAPDLPLFGSITRLADQKGVDIQLGALEEMLAAPMQFCLLGSGSPEFEQGYHNLARRHPGKVAIRLGYNQGLSHRIEAGCDFFLMPSKFEPCGLNQLYSQRYGTIPIVRVTGGLDDTVVDLTEEWRNRDQVPGIFRACAVQSDSQGTRLVSIDGAVRGDAEARHDGGFFLGPHLRRIRPDFPKGRRDPGLTAGTNFGLDCREILRESGNR